MQTSLDSLGYPALTPTKPLKKITVTTIHNEENSEYKKSNKSSTNYIFEDAMQHPSWSIFSWDGFHLPGQSEPYRTCGQWGVIGCLNSHLHKGNDVYLNAYQKNCSRSVCCMCVESWANKEANRAVRRHVKRIKNLGGKPSHVVFSPPPCSVSWDFKTIDKEFKKISKKIGVTGSSVIFHPARFHNEKMIPYASPHFHTIAYGWFDGIAISKISKESGWTVKKIRTIKNEGEIFATIKYLLSHAGIKRNKIVTKFGTIQLRACHTVRWLGDISYRKLKVEKEPKEEQSCPECGFKLQKLRLKDGLSSLDRPPPPKNLIGFFHCNVFEIVETLEKSPYYDTFWNEIQDESKIEKDALLESSVTGKRTSYFCHRLNEFQILN